MAMKRINKKTNKKRRAHKKTIKRTSSKKKTIHRGVRKLNKKRKTRKMRGGNIPLKLVANVPYPLNKYDGLDVARSLKYGGANPLTNLVRSIDFNVKQMYNNTIGRETLVRENPHTVVQ